MSRSYRYRLIVRRVRVVGVTILFAALLILALNTFAVSQQRAQKTAQQEIGPGTKFQNLLLRQGTVIIKEFIDIGTLEGMYNEKLKIAAIALTIPNEAAESKAYAVRFDQFGSPNDSRYESSGMIDFDELVSLQSALDQMIKIGSEMKLSAPRTEASITSRPNQPILDITSTPGGRHVEVVFNSRGLQAGFFEWKGAFVGFVALNQVGSISLNRYSTGASVHMPFSQLSELSTLLESARKGLSELGAK